MHYTDGTVCFLSGLINYYVAIKLIDVHIQGKAHSLTTLSGGISVC